MPDILQMSLVLYVFVYCDCVCDFYIQLTLGLKQKLQASFKNALHFSYVFLIKLFNSASICT